MTKSYMCKFRQLIAGQNIQNLYFKCLSMNTKTKDIEKKSADISNTVYTITREA